MQILTLIPVLIDAGGRLAPLVIVFAAVILLVLVSAFIKGKKDFNVSMWVAAAGLVAAFFAAWVIWPAPPMSSFVTLIFDRLSVTGWFVVLASALFTVLMSKPSPAFAGRRMQDYYALIMIAVIGMGVLIAAGDLISIIIGLETMSVAVYALVAYLRDRESSVEGALKYFVIGAFATAFFVMGIAFVFGSSGSTDLNVIAERALFVGTGENAIFFQLGIALVTIGFAFKTALVPFHAWAPDAYEGASVPVTSFMATAVKAAAFIAFVRFASAVAGGGGILWHSVLWGLAAATMIIGNIAAIRQDNLKRMLAYSSIAHAGFMLTVFPSIAADAVAAKRAIILYLISYAIMTIGAFAVLAAIEEESGEPADISKFKGLVRRRPYISAAFAVFLLSLAGFPPTIGFFGKYYLFLAAVKNGDVALVVVAVVATVISVYFYLRPVVAMYFSTGKVVENVGSPATPVLSHLFVIIIALLVVSAVVFGIMPQNLVALAEGSVF